VRGNDGDATGQGSIEDVELVEFGVANSFGIGVLGTDVAEQRNAGVGEYAEVLFVTVTAALTRVEIDVLRGRYELSWSTGCA
jgi:hypothetical protein